MHNLVARPFCPFLIQTIKVVRHGIGINRITATDRQQNAIDAILWRPLTSSWHNPFLLAAIRSFARHLLWARTNATHCTTMESPRVDSSFGPHLFSTMHTVLYEGWAKWTPSRSCVMHNTTWSHSTTIQCALSSVMSEQWASHPLFIGDHCNSADLKLHPRICRHTHNFYSGTGGTMIAKIGPGDTIDRVLILLAIADVAGDGDNIF